jgi:curved DNA-binding protein CbpA
VAAASPPPAPSPPPSAPQPFAPLADVELDVDHQREIHDLHGRLEDLDLYAILGVARGADKKTVKRAYFERTARFHPDRFFRKKLGPFKMQMEAVFGRMTLAHDTLTNADRRAEYDAYLSSKDKSRTIERRLADAVEEVRRAEEIALASDAPGAFPAEPATSAKGEARPSSPPSAPSASNRFGPEPTTSTGGAPPSAPRKANAGGATPSNDFLPQSRRELLARRLMGAPGATSQGRQPAVTAAARVATPGTAIRADEAVDALKRRYEEKVSQARALQAKKYVQEGLDARGRGDWVAAAHALKVALTFEPDNGELTSTYEEAQKNADKLLVDQYVKQAEYEERNERWADAAKSWHRVAEARQTDATSFEHAARCLMKADGNLHEAATLGQKAVQLAPKSARARVALANVYLAAGLAKNAKRELEAAAQLAPDDASVQALLKRVARSA